MRILLTVFLLLCSITGARSAYIISCSGGITGINQTGEETIMVNGVAANYIFTSNDYDNFTNSTNCVANEVPDNQVFSGNAL